MGVYEHFREDETDFIDQVEDWKNQVANLYEAKLTGFLNPREQKIVSAVIGGQHDTVRLSFFGGIEEAERKRALLYPFYEDAEHERFQIKMLQSTYADKFVQLKHRDILGALMALGLKRELFGDVILTDETVQLFLASEMSDFVRLHLQKAGSASLRLEARPFDVALSATESWEEHVAFVSSLRLDTVMAAMYRLPRSKAKAYIERERVKINWAQTEDPGMLLSEEDVISVRGLGRRKLLLIEKERTRKGKIRIVYGRKDE